MNVESSQIYLTDVATGSQVAGELRDAIEDAQLADWQTKWGPALSEVLQNLANRGVPRAQWPQSSHWDWQRKTEKVSGLLGFKGFSVLAFGETQGLALVDLTQTARVQSDIGKPLVYVDYLEVAPWNRPELGTPARLRGVGTALIVAAAALSVDEGFKGRIGLHSLPQADAFYRERCGMTDLGQDARYQNLRYFEFTSAQAETFLK